MAGRDRRAVVEQALCALANLSRETLVESWIKAHGHPPPKGVKRGLLERDHAYRLQARAFGRLKASTARKLLAIARGEIPASSNAASKLKPGSRLVRQWGGVTHHVETIEDGYLWNDQRYPSLSAVARAITGAHWSGPRFFGL